MLQFPLHAQNQSITTLTLQDALKLGIENNYELKNARQNTILATNNAVVGATGLLPVVSLNVSSANSINTTRQEFVNGNIQERNNANANNINLGPVMVWNILDGNNSFIEYKLNQGFSEATQLAERVNLQTLVAQIYRAYYQAVFQKSLMQSIEQTSTIFEERLKLARVKNEVGVGSITELYQAQIDLNTVASELIKQHKVYQLYLTQLKEVLVLSPESAIDVADTIIRLNSIDGVKLRQQVIDTSPLIQYNSALKSLVKQRIKLVNSQRLPVFSVNLGYNMLFAKSQAGQVLSNRSIGPTFGFNFSLPIFSGNHLNRLVHNAKINANIADNTFQAISQREQILFNRFYDEHQDNLQIVALEDKNIAFSKSNVLLAIERYKNDKLSGIELQMIIKSNLEVQNRVLAAYKDAKLSEIELLHIAGELVK